MTSRVAISPVVLRWALERSGRSTDELVRRFPAFSNWVTEEEQPTLRQLEGYAQFTHTPVGFFFLDEPPVEELPIADFRTVGDRGVERPSADLLQTIYDCEQRQAWFHDYAEAVMAEDVPLVGSMSLQGDALVAADRLRDALGFDMERRRNFRNWSEALNGLIEHVEDAGILVMVNGVVGTNPHRKLDPDEFRGFSISDPFAPVIFINGSDFKAAQIFSLAHELGHIALGESAVSRPDLADPRQADIESEKWCNAVAAELLVPADSLLEEFSVAAPIGDEVQRLAKLYRVSTLVVIRRLLDVRLIGKSQFHRVYEAEIERIKDANEVRASGGNFYFTQPRRVSKRFARALIADTIEGRTSHRDAMQMLGCKKFSAFEELRHQLGVA